MNANQFLQTSRTVTFLIQKNKDSISNFDSWYQSVVVDAWRQNTVMTWAKDSRNKIEKQGDIDYLSTVKATLIGSYFENEDRELQFSNEELISAGVLALTKQAYKYLSERQLDGCVVRIQREWKATTLPTWELLQAFAYIYTRQFNICKELAAHMSVPLHHSIQEPAALENSVRESRQIVYVNLGDGTQGRHRSKKILIDRKHAADAIDKDVQMQLGSVGSKPESVLKAFAMHCRLVEILFNSQSEYHPSIFMYNKAGECIHQGGTVFSDRADKYMYWRLVSEQVKVLSPNIIVWVAESWQRKYSDKRSDIRIEDLEIIGELVDVTVLDRNLNAVKACWPITSKNGIKALGEIEVSDSASDILQGANFLAPIVHAFVRLK
ncbi:hypothetical protein OAM69_00865, partial [bacterium]|nr:hypothetical protein [bacterium]